MADCSSASRRCRGAPRRSTRSIDAQAGKAFIVQTNSAGDSIHLIDPATDKIVAEIPDEEVVHGIAAAPDGSRFYATNESTITLDVDRRAHASGHQEDSADRPARTTWRSARTDARSTPAFRRRDGGVDVIDTTTLREDQVHQDPAAVSTIRLPRLTASSWSPVPPAATSRPSSIPRLDQPVWSIHFEGGVRVFCFEANPDGSTKRMFTQVTNLHGFAIVDWASRKEVGRIKLPELPPAERNSEGIQGAPAHGILVVARRQDAVDAPARSTATSTPTRCPISSFWAE